MTPFLNDSIKNYKYPFLFKFETHEGIAVMQYMQFTGFQTWLPAKPGAMVYDTGMFPQVLSLSNSIPSGCVAVYVSVFVCQRAKCL